MKSTLLSLVFIFLYLFISAQITYKARSENKYLDCFSEKIKGDELAYLSLCPQYLNALLVRSKDSANYMEWKTEAIPANYSKDTADFLMFAGIDVNEDSHQFYIYINGEKKFIISNPKDHKQRNYSWRSPSGERLEFGNIELDRYDDYMGIFILHVPVNNCKKGEPLTIRVHGESAGSFSWFMVFERGAVSELSIVKESMLKAHRMKHRKSVEINFIHLQEQSKILAVFGDSRKEIDLHFGRNVFKIFTKISKGKQVKSIPLQLYAGNKLLLDTNIQTDDNKPIKIYLLPHSHVDIGYTHVQSEVELRQWSNLEQAIEIAENHKNYPPEARFKWNVEVIWALDSYLKKSPHDKKDRMIKAIKDGVIGLNGLYANILTGLMSPEELLRVTESARKLSKESGKELTTAMISDIPGWSWSIVPALAKSNIRYFSCGINNDHRIGQTKQLGDQPFYWVSPSREDKVLCWVHDKGYSSFHGIENLNRLRGIGPIKAKIYKAFEDAMAQHYQYDILPLRYNVNGDNGGPDKNLCERVKKWNKKYKTPKLVIATADEFFKIFEEKYGKSLPELSGDFTPYWEDGACSSAKETSMNRVGNRKLTQAMKLFAQFMPESCPSTLFDNAWQYALLFDEHTWGSWNSVSEPECEFTKQQWKIKKSFVDSVIILSNLLFKDAIGCISGKNTRTFDVINTNSFRWSDIVEIPVTAIQNSDFELRDESNSPVPYQKLSDGKYIFIAHVIAGFGSKRFHIDEVRKNKKGIKSDISSKNDYISNQYLKIKFNTITGDIQSLVDKQTGFDFVDQNSNTGLNAYIYQKSREWDDLSFVENNSLNIKDTGDVIVTIEAVSHGKGCKEIRRQVSIVSGLNRVYINDIFNKEKVYSPEAIHLAFPFGISNETIRIENAIGTYIPGTGQIRGSNHNYYTFNNYADISGDKNGITFISPDAPLIETGRITNDPRQTRWLTASEKSPHIFSYAMNNFWTTNYCAYQEGIINLRYYLFPYQEYSDVKAFNNSTGCMQPLVAVCVKADSKPLVPVLSYYNENVSIIAMRTLENGKNVWAAIYNPSSDNQIINIITNEKVISLYKSDIDFNKIEFQKTFTIKPFDIIFVMAELR